MVNLPSIWLGSFSGYEDFQDLKNKQKNIIDLMEDIDFRSINSIKPFILTGYCSICKDVKEFNFSWKYGGIDSNGQVHLARTETGICRCCYGNSRIRALYDYVDRNFSNVKNVYISEFLTPAYKTYKKLLIIF